MSIVDNSSCVHLWQAKALVDGRLGERERQEFDLHAVSCRECRTEIESLDALRSVMKEIAVPPVSAPDHRSQREELLRKANEAVLSGGVKRELRSNQRSAIAFGAVVMASVIVYWGTTHYRNENQIAATKSNESAAAAVQNTSLLPEPDPTTTTTLPADSAPAIVASAHPTPRPPTSGAAKLFDQGVEAFAAGEYDRADKELARFVEHFPDDPRCEDADYLRAVSRHRAGDREGATKQARAYLAKYPHGLRRVDAVRIVESP